MEQLAPEVTARLRKLAEKSKGSKGPPPLPDPGERFAEMEAAKAWGIPWGEWLLMSPTHRAEMWAHEQHRALREAAMGDVAGELEKESRPSARDAMLSRLGIPS